MSPETGIQSRILEYFALTWNPIAPGPTMSTNSTTVNSHSATWSEAKELYVQLLHFFYDQNEELKAKSIALSLLRVIDSLDPSSKTLIGNEYRALIAEVDGDVEGAIRYREAWVKMVDKFTKKKKLQELALTADDYSDQLDLLAVLYCQSGRLSEAEVIINKSASVCLEAGIPFDGKDVLKEIKMKQTQAKRKRADVKMRQNQKSKASITQKASLTPAALAQSSAPTEAPAHQ